MINDQGNEPKEQGRVTQSVAPIAGRAELQNREPDSGQQYPRTQTNQCYENIKRWWRIIFKDFKRRLHKASFALEVVAILVAGIYTFEAWRANSLTREALQSVQRAFVVYKDLSAYAYLDVTKNYQQRFLVRPLWENSGSTPTRDLRIYVSEPKPTQPPFKNLDFSQPTNTVFTPMMIAPHEVVSGSDREIPADDIVKLHDGKGFFYVWGWATYRDTFPKTKRHMTRFCVVLTGALFDSKDTTIATTKSVGLINEFCPVHNCADEECEEQDRDAKK